MPIRGSSKMQVGIQRGMHLQKLQPVVAVIRRPGLEVLWS